MFDVIAIEKETNKKIPIKSFFEKKTAEWYIKQTLESDPFGMLSQLYTLTIEQR